MSSMPMEPGPMAPMMVATMVAMMLPSLAPTLWRYQRHLRALRTPRPVQRTTLFATGYASVWTGVALALSTVSGSRTGPFATGAIILCAGAPQRSRWKAKQLLRCRESCVPARSLPSSFSTALWDGCRLGVGCTLSCAAPMAVLFVGGLMDARTMLVITVAITAERVAPGGVRIARLTGTLALVVGLAVCARAMAGHAL